MPVGIKKNGTLAKGYKYAKGGKVVKAGTAAAKAKRKTTKRKTKKK